jgi:hypothetical protein
MRSFLEKWGPTLLYVACAFAALTPAFASPSLFADRYDWRYFEAMGEMSRRSVSWWHQVALWNPYSCGGEVGLANPQSLDFAPTFLLVLLFGVAVGYKLALAVYYFCAMDGTRRLARRFGVSRAGAVLSGLGFGLSGYLALHWSEGHFTFLGVSLFPYLLLCYDRALDAIEWIIPTGLVACWIAVDGGTFTPPMAGELLLLWGTLESIKRKSLKPLLLLPSAGVVALVVGAVRMFPVLEFVRAHPRPPFMRATDWSGPWHILADLTSWRWFGELPGRKYWSHEYTARIPYALLPLWAFGLWLAGSKRIPEERRWVARRLLFLAGFGTLLTMGNFWRYAPWSLLQRLPVLRDLRVPSRHEVLIVLPLALLAGVTWDFVAKRISERHAAGTGRRLAWLAPALILLAAADGAIYSALQWRGVFVAQRQLPTQPPRFYQSNVTWREMRDTQFAGHGTVRPAGSTTAECDEEAPLQRADELDAGDVAQERLLDPAAGEVLRTLWSPNQRVVAVKLDRPTILLINSNWNEHWKTDRGRLTRVAGRLAVDLAALGPGTHVVTLTYAPRSFTLGMAVSALALPLLVGFFLFARRRRAARASQ